MNNCLYILINIFFCYLICINVLDDKVKCLNRQVIIHVTNSVVMFTRYLFIFLCNECFGYKTKIYHKQGNNSFNELICQFKKTRIIWIIRII